MGDGSLIKTWRDAWIPRGHNLRPVTPKCNCRLHWVADFIDEHVAWKELLLREHFWELDVREILKIRTSPRNGQDFLAWFPERSGQFSVKSAYRLAAEDHMALSLGWHKQEAVELVDSIERQPARTRKRRTLAQRRRLVRSRGQAGTGDGVGYAGGGLGALESGRIKLQRRQQAPAAAPGLQQAPAAAAAAACISHLSKIL